MVPSLAATGTAAALAAVVAATRGRLLLLSLAATGTAAALAAVVAATRGRLLLPSLAAEVARCVASMARGFAWKKNC